MTDQLNRWLSPPVFPDDEAKTRRAVLLNAALLNILTLMSVLLIGNWLGGKTPLPVFAADFTAIALCLILRAWMRRGNVRAASIGLMLLGLVLITASAASLGTIRAPTTAMYLLMVITGGLLFDLRGMMLTAVICSALIAGLIGAENAGLLPRPDYAVTITQWIAYTAIFGWTGSLTFSALRETRLALLRADSDIAERKRVEEVLRASEERYRLLAETAHDLIFIMDRQGGMSYVNSFLARQFELTPEEIIGKKMEEFFPPHVADRQRRNVEKVFETGKPLYVEAESRFPRAHIWLGTWLTPITDQTGRVSAVMGISRDITERKRADQALRESEARFRELFENANDIVYTHDLAGNFTSINRATEQVTGYARDEALTMNIAQVIAPEYLEPIRQWLDPKGIGQGPLTHELEIITKDGRRVLLELGTRLIFREGKPVGVQGIARDITARKRAEAALAQERNLLHTLFDHLPDSVWIKDTESRFVMGNLGVTRHVGAATPEEIIGKSDFDFFPKDLAEQYYADEQQVVRSGQPLLNKEEIVEDQTTGKRLWNLVTKVPLRNAAGNIVGLVGIGRDITARKRAEEKLRESEARLRLALQSAPVTMFRQDRELKYTWIHNVQVAMQPEEIVGKSDSDFVPPDQAARLTELKGRALTSGNKVRDEVNVVVQGALYSYEMIVEPERDAAGQIVGITGVTWDITERKRAEQKLQESETKFRAVFETSVDAIGVSKKGAHVFVNPAYCTLFGYGSAGELVGTSILNLIAPEQREKIAQNVRRRARNEAIPSFYETRGLRKDGSEFEMDVHISTYELQGETFSLVILRDITEQKQAKAVQQRSHEELEQRVQARTAELQQFVDLMVGREIRMAELKSVVRQLRAQLQSAGMTPVADDPLAAGME